MPVNLNAIDTRIRKLQKLRDLLADDETRELMADPEIMGFLKDTISHNGNGSKPHPATDSPDEAEEAEGPGVPWEGSLKRKVLDTARGCPDKFDVRYIVEKMKLGGYEFAAADPKIAVNQALRSLTKRKLVKLVRAGSGRIPNIYRAIREGESSK